MGTISRRKQAIRDAAERVAPDLDKWRRRNRYFHDEDARYLQFLISPEVRVLDLGCGNGDLLASLRPSEGKGVDFSPAMVALAKRPTPHYLVPSLVVIAMLMPLALHFVIEGRQHIRAAVAVGSIGLLSLLVQHGISALEFEVAGAERADVALRQMTARLQQANCRPLPYYRFSSPEYAMLFGNDFMGQVYAKRLTQLYPDYITFNIWAEHIADFSGVRDDASEKQLLAAGRPLCLVGTVELDGRLHKTDITLLAKDGGYFLYRLLGFH